MALAPIKYVTRGSTDTLLRASRANELIERVRSLENTKVLIGGDGASRFEVGPAHSALVITKDDLLAALPAGAAQQITVATINPTAGQGRVGDLWITYNPVNPILGVFDHPFFFTGALVLNQIFGYFEAGAGAVLTGAQVFAQTPPTGSDIILTLVNGAGASWGQTVTLPAGQNIAGATFNLTIPAAGIVQAKITQIGATTPGEFLTLILRVNQQ